MGWVAQETNSEGSLKENSWGAILGTFLVRAQKEEGKGPGDCGEQSRQRSGGLLQPLLLPLPLLEHGSSEALTETTEEVGLQGEQLSKSFPGTELSPPKWDAVKKEPLGP